MNNSLVKIKEIRGEVRMRRDELELFENQTRMLTNNLSKLLGEDHVRANHPVLVDSYMMYQRARFNKMAGVRA